MRVGLTRVKQVGHDIGLRSLQETSILFTVCRKFESQRGRHINFVRWNQYVLFRNLLLFLFGISGGFLDFEILSRWIGFGIVLCNGKESIKYVNSQSRFVLIKQREEF